MSYFGTPLCIPYCDTLNKNKLGPFQDNIPNARIQPKESKIKVSTSCPTNRTLFSPPLCFSSFSKWGFKRSSQGNVIMSHDWNYIMITIFGKVLIMWSTRQHHQKKEACISFISFQHFLGENNPPNWIFGQLHIVINTFTAMRFYLWTSSVHRDIIMYSGT